MKSAQQLRSPATLLVGFDPRTALAVARSLHRRGIRVIIATIADWETPLPSNAVAAYVKVPHRDSPDHFFDELTRVISAENIDTILPMTDRALRALSPHLDKLRKTCAVECASTEQLAIILNKNETSRIAATLGVPCPRTFSSAHLLETESTIRFPVFAKLRDKLLQDDLADPCDPAVGLANTPSELTEFLQRYGEENLIIQEYAAGDDVGLVLIFANGECHASFQYRAHRLYPNSGGVCTLAITERVSPDLLSAASRMLTELQWNGIAQIDFRHNPSTNRFYLLEINGRFWGSTAVAIKAGADFPRYVRQRLHGAASIKPVPYKIGQEIRWLEGDLRRLAQYYKACRASGAMSGFYKELFSTIKSFDPRVAGMFWSWRDPKPCLHTLKTMVWYSFLGKLHRLRDKIWRRSKASPTIGIQDDNNIAPIASTKR